MAFPIPSYNCLLLIYWDFSLTSSIVFIIYHQTLPESPFQNFIFHLPNSLSLLWKHPGPSLPFFFFLTCTITVLHCLILNIHHDLARVIQSMLYCIKSLLFEVSSVAHLYAENEIQTLCAANKSLHSWVPAHLPLLAEHLPAFRSLWHPVARGL